MALEQGKNPFPQLRHFHKKRYVKTLFNSVDGIFRRRKLKVEGPVKNHDERDALNEGRKF
jgi:hypothetical protein